VKAGEAGQEIITLLTPCANHDLVETVPSRNDGFQPAFAGFHLPYSLWIPANKTN
jgi:hypothetical protein